MTTETQTIEVLATPMILGIADLLENAILAGEIFETTRSHGLQMREMWESLYGSAERKLIGPLTETGKPTVRWVEVRILGKRCEVVPMGKTVTVEELEDMMSSDEKLSHRRLEQAAAAEAAYRTGGGYSHEEYNLSQDN